ncbi:MAG: hypothetical protein KA201_02395 [Kofleriaceae bacterium]|nr:hypothetical protein [Kofleriaceae bacterium]
MIGAVPGAALVPSPNALRALVDTERPGGPTSRRVPMSGADAATRRAIGWRLFATGGPSPIIDRALEHVDALALALAVRSLDPEPPARTRTEQEIDASAARLAALRAERAAVAAALEATRGPYAAALAAGGDITSQIAAYVASKYGPALLTPSPPAMLLPIDAARGALLAAGEAHLVAIDRLIKNADEILVSDRAAARAAVRMTGGRVDAAAASRAEQLAAAAHRAEHWKPLAHTLRTAGWSITDLADLVITGNGPAPGSRRGEAVGWLAPLCPVACSRYPHAREELVARRSGGRALGVVGTLEGWIRRDLDRTD